MTHGGRGADTLVDSPPVRDAGGWEATAPVISPAFPPVTHRRPTRRPTGWVVSGLALMLLLLVGGLGWAACGLPGTAGVPVVPVTAPAHPTAVSTTQPQLQPTTAPVPPAEAAPPTLTRIVARTATRTAVRTVTRAQPAPAAPRETVTTTVTERKDSGQDDEDNDD